MEYRRWKRAADAASAAVLLAGLSPLFAAIAVAIRVDSEGPVVFRQARVGRDGELFELLKFRTMTTAAPTVPTAELHQAASFITPVGRWLRLTSLDELPQIVNILRGEMSFIGPRPVIAAEERLTELRREAGVLTVRPGITGWAQVNGRDLVSVEAKVRFDREYVENLSLRWDLRCLARTVGAVLRRDGIVEGNQVFAVISEVPEPAGRRSRVRGRWRSRR